MNIKGKVISCLPTETGQGKNGTWVKNIYIIETPGQYSKKVAVSLWGETLPVLKVDQEVDCHIDIESREYNQRWYTEVKCFKVDFITNGTPKVDKSKQSAKPSAAISPEQEEFNNNMNPDGPSDELPF